VDSLYDYIVDMLRYELLPAAKNIACPTFIAQALDDPVADFAPKPYEAITQPKVLVPFTAAEGASMHTKALTRTLYDQRMFDWLDETLGVGARGRGSRWRASQERPAPARGVARAMP
jgi:hypothetical protein